MGQTRKNPKTELRKNPKTDNKKESENRVEEV